MTFELKLPPLAIEMEEGVIAKWLVKPGDRVKHGDVIAEVETDKTTLEFEAPEEGTIVELLVPAGLKLIKVGTVIAIMKRD